MNWISSDAKQLMKHTGCNLPIEAIATKVRALLVETDQILPPVDLRLLASYRRVKQIDEVQMPQAGRIRYDRQGQCCFIEINIDHTQGKKRFSTAHEIMHTLMPSWQLGAETSDDETGLYLRLDWSQLKEYQEREFLCGHGAAAILYPRDWFSENAENFKLSISAIRELAAMCESSLDSAAFQISQHCSEIAAVVFWEPGLRKADEAKAMMKSLPGFDVSPMPKYRVVKVYPSRAFRTQGVFIPPKKSVPLDSIVSQSEHFGKTSGQIQLAIDSKDTKFWSENYFAPFGERRRIISVLRLA